MGSINHYLIHTLVRRGGYDIGGGAIAVSVEDVGCLLSNFTRALGEDSLEEVGDEAIVTADACVASLIVGEPSLRKISTGSLSEAAVEDVMRTERVLKRRRDNRNVGQEQERKGGEGGCAGAGLDAHISD